jgi:hypothetical protein
VAATGDTPIDDEHGPDRNATLGQPLPRFVDCRPEEWIHRIKGVRVV